MALQIMEGFESLESDAELEERPSWWRGAYGSAGEYQDLDTGHHSTYSYKLHTYITSVGVFLEERDEFYVGFSFKHNSDGSNAADFCGFAHITTSPYNYLRLNTDLTVSLITNDAGTVATTTKTLTANTWYYLEIRMKNGTTDGVFELKVDGTVEATNSTCDTSYNGFKWRYFTFERDQVDIWFDNFYVVDTDGSSHNSYLGEQTIELIRPTGAGNYAQFTASAGSNYACVDEATPNGDTDYVEGEDFGKKDTYAMGDLSTNGTTVNGCKVIVKAEPQRYGYARIKGLARSSATDGEGVETDVIGTDYEWVESIVEYDPNGGGGWTKTTVDAAEFGFTL